MRDGKLRKKKVEIKKKTEVPSEVRLGTEDNENLLRAAAMMSNALDDFVPFVEDQYFGCDLTSDALVIDSDTADAYQYINEFKPDVGRRRETDLPVVLHVWLPFKVPH